MGRSDDRPGSAAEAQQGYHAGGEGPRPARSSYLRFNHLFPPFDNPAIRRVVVGAMDQKEIMEAVAGPEPSLIKTDVGVFVPGTPMASTVGVKMSEGRRTTRSSSGISSPPATRARRSSSSRPPRFRPSGPRRSFLDTLKKIGMDTNFQALEWGTVVARRAGQELIDKGGWNISTRISAATETSHQRRTSPSRAAVPEQLVRLADRREDGGTARRLVQRRKRSGAEGACEAMGVKFWKSPPYAPLSERRSLAHQTDRRGP